MTQPQSELIERDLAAIVRLVAADLDAAVERAEAEYNALPSPLTYGACVRAYSTIADASRRATLAEDIAAYYRLVASAVPSSPSPVGDVRYAHDPSDISETVPAVELDLISGLSNRISELSEVSSDRFERRFPLSSAEVTDQDKNDSIQYVLSRTQDEWECFERLLGSGMRGSISDDFAALHAAWSAELFGREALDWWATIRGPSVAEQMFLEHDEEHRTVNVCMLTGPASLYCALEDFFTVHPLL